MSRKKKSKSTKKPVDVKKNDTKKEELTEKKDKVEAAEPETSVEADEGEAAAKDTPPAAETKPAPLPAETPCCCGGHEQEVACCSDDHPMEGPERAEYLFNMSSFVMTVISIFIIFGAFIQAKPFWMIVYERNAFLNKALLLGILVLEVAILMKLYAVLLKFRIRPLSDTIPDNRSDWILKVGAFTFITTATVRVVQGILQSRQLMSLAKIGRRLNAITFEADGLVTQSFSMASFFLLLAIFSLVYLLHSKYSRNTGNEAA